MPTCSQRQNEKIDYSGANHQPNAVKRKMALILIRILLGSILLLFTQTLCADPSRCISLCDDLYLSSDHERQWKKCITNCVEADLLSTEYTEKPEGYSPAGSISDSPGFHLRSNDEKYEYFRGNSDQHPLMIRMEKNLYERCTKGDRQACKILLSIKQKK